MLKIEKEIWKDVKGFEGCYQISNHCKIKSLSRRINSSFGKTRVIPERYINPSIDSNGYRILQLIRYNKRRTIRLHRLLALHFIPNPENKPEVNHKDGIKLNNSLSNLEWATHKENAIHSYKNGMTKKPKPSGHKGEQCHNALLKEKDVISIRQYFDYGISVKVLADAYNVSIGCIKQIGYRRTWKHI